MRKGAENRGKDWGTGEDSRASFHSREPAAQSCRNSNGLDKDGAEGGRGKYRN